MTVLKSFRVARFELALRALDPIKLPPHAGSTLRGGFGRAFRRIGCAASALGAEQCSLGDRCPYHYIFETPVPAGSPILARVGTAPRPFVIEPPLDTNGTYEPGARITVGLILIGRSIDYLPYFIYTFEQLGDTGLGPGRGRYRVDSVASVPVAGPSTVIYDSSRRQLAVDVPPFGVDELPQGPKDCASITLTFLTPTRLIHNGKNATPVDFHVFFRNVLRRVNFLNHFHCGGELRDDAMDLIAAARAVRTVDVHLQWQEWDRYSARQDQRVPMGGFVGRIVYSGDISAVWPWLRFGESVHVGKGATFGLGRYRLGHEAPGAA